MTFLGLGAADILILVCFFAGMLLIGKFAARTVKVQTDYYLAGRNLGKVLQFFLNFGSMTDSVGAPVTASEVYRQGLGGSWLQFQYVFLTPFTWFTKIWWRRARVVTMGDLLAERFDSRACGALFALYAIVLYTVLIGFGNVTTYKVMRGVLTKPASQYSEVDRQRMNDYAQYVALNKAHQQGSLKAGQEEQFRALAKKNESGELSSYISYLGNPLPFYLSYSSVIATYIVLGGFLAAVYTDAIQGILIVIFSVMLIPFGLQKIGGIGVLQRSVPEQMSHLFGGGATSEYSWNSVLAILLVTFIGSFSSAHDMTITGSAQDESSARVGGISGAFAKRLVTLAWIFCGLLAVGIWGTTVSDPDMIWGMMCRDLLPTGFLGLMLAGILGGHMSSLNASILTSSALFVRNAYMVAIPGKSEMHYLLVGRIAAAVVLLAGLGVALFSTGIVSLFKVVLTLPVTFGSVVLLALFWRSLTKWAVLITVPVCLLLLGVLPYFLPLFHGFRTRPDFLVQTPERTDTVVVAATQSDIDSGSAKLLGERMEKRIVSPPKNIFFESAARSDPQTNQILEGGGRFNMEVYLASRVGVRVGMFNPAQLLALRFGVCAALPFALLITLSFLTKPVAKQKLDQFYVKMKTPVAADAEDDLREMRLSFATPDRFDDLKLFPSSQWEFCRWNRRDTVGFLLCWLGVGGVIGLLWLLSTLIR